MELTKKMMEKAESKAIDKITSDVRVAKVGQNDDGCYIRLVDGYLFNGAHPIVFDKTFQLVLLNLKYIKKAKETV